VNIDRDPLALRRELVGRINALAERRGVHRAELARRMGVTQPYVSEILNGRRRLTLTFIAKALAALDAELDDLILVSNRLVVTRGAE